MYWTRKKFLIHVSNIYWTYVHTETQRHRQTDETTKYRTATNCFRALIILNFHILFYKHYCFRGLLAFY